MGIRLMVEVLDYAPTQLTPRERYALIVLAEDARDDTRLCSKGVESNEKVMRRLRAGLSGRKEIIKALIDKGALERVTRGQRYQHAEFRILPLAPEALAQQPENAAPEGRVSSRETRPLSDSQQPGFPDPEGRQQPETPAPEGLSGAGKYGPLPLTKSTTTKEPSSRPGSSKAPSHDPLRPDVEQLCDRLMAWLVKKEFRQRPDKVTAAWRTEARLLLDKDGVPLAEALEVLDWSQRDFFWTKNIHSMPKFRAQYSQLEIKSREDRSHTAPRPGQGHRAPGADPRKYAEEDYHDQSF